MRRRPTESPSRVRDPPSKHEVSRGLLAVAVALAAAKAIEDELQTEVHGDREDDAGAGALPAGHREGDGSQAAEEACAFIAGPRLPRGVHGRAGLAADLPDHKPL
ncbi:unnamed protein product [Prorocentrum cordatum]|uniref:Uncharacterized protein n=1 Tax=Prorocentrum cordatum TaxID=2364126 RepID=A0ABN9WLQ0_9DINO|nr:unnamed protein product [Polarella glacialis]